MLKIAVCDDDPKLLTDITTLLTKYQKARHMVITVDAFISGIELLEAMKGKSYDFLVMDIVMPGLTGIQIAREIRDYNSEIPLIFLTSSPEFAVESYSVEAFSYLLKPVNEDALFSVLDRLVKKMLRGEDSLVLTLAAGVIRFPYSGIEYVEINSKHLNFHMEDNTVRELPGSLSEMETRLLCRSEFMKVHRSYIVNLSQVQELETKELKMYSGKRVPVARALSVQVRQRYTDYLFEDEGGNA